MSVQYGPVTAAPLAAALLALTACTGPAPAPTQWSAPPAMRIDVNREYTAAILTTLGEIQIKLHAREAPNTVNNFVFLARAGFYEGVKFHRIVKDFMIQTGDPTETGRGGAGYRIVDEPVSGEYERGAVAMANAGRPNTGGSQFFIVQGENVYLPKTYTIFAKVVAGIEIVDAIAAVPVGMSDSGELSVPQQDVRVQRITIAER